MEFVNIVGSVRVNDTQAGKNALEALIQAGIRTEIHSGGISIKTTPVTEENCFIVEVQIDGVVGDTHQLRSALRALSGVVDQRSRVDISHDSADDPWSLNAQLKIYP